MLDLDFVKKMKFKNVFEKHLELMSTDVRDVIRVEASPSRSLGPRASARAGGDET